MTDRLDKLAFLPPGTGTPWSGTPLRSTVTKITRPDGVPVLLPKPLFWCDPPWHQAPPEIADIIGCAVADFGVTVSALRRDFSAGESPSTFHGSPPASDEPLKTSSASPSGCLPRIVPYRPERYGLADTDFDDALIVDLRLSLPRDEAGRFAYSPEQIARWEATGESRPLAGGGWVPAATFPPDVPSLQGLHSKIDQLRTLSPTAAVFVSMTPYRLDQELSAVIAQQPDGIILRCEDVPLGGLALAAMTRRARQWMKHAGHPQMPLWISPGPLSADDAVKLIALGASAVAIDPWCNPLIESAQEATAKSAAARLGYASLRSAQQSVVAGLVQQHLLPRQRRFEGLMLSLSAVAAEQRLATLDAAWSNALGVPHLSYGVQG